jgi:hypothetical protein
MFSCFKKNNQVSNHVFDLMDIDGDNAVKGDELRIVAGYLHRAAVTTATQHLHLLQATDAVNYVNQLTGKKSLKISDFRKLQHHVPASVWQNQVLPELRRSEINRLSNYNNY